MGCASSKKKERLAAEHKRKTKERIEKLQKSVGDKENALSLLYVKQRRLHEDIARDRQKCAASTPPSEKCIMWLKELQTVKDDIKRVSALKYQMSVRINVLQATQDMDDLVAEDEASIIQHGQHKFAVASDAHEDSVALLSEMSSVNECLPTDWTEMLQAVLRDQGIGHQESQVPSSAIVDAFASSHPLISAAALPSRATVEQRTALPV